MADESLNRIEHAIITFVRRNTDERRYREFQRRADSDLERASAVMLWRIGDHQPVRLSALADVAGVELSTASRQVANLVDRGYVDRRPDPDDGRATVHRLTDAGRELLQRIVDARHEIIEKLLDGFDEVERDTFADLLERFVAAME